MAGFSGYPKGSLDAFYKIINESEIKKFTEKIKGTLALPDALSCLSIGAGSGDMDVFFINHIMPNLRCYQAVEPYPQQLRVLHKTIGEMAAKKPQFETHFYKMLGEDITGPEGGKKVDVILLFNVLYYVRDPEGFIKRCKSWLTPGGHIFIILANNSAVDMQVGKVLNTPRNNFLVKPLEEMVKDAGFATTRKYQMPVTYDFRNISRDLVSFYLLREADEKEEAIFRQFVLDLCGESCLKTCNVELFVCRV